MALLAMFRGQVGNARSSRRYPFSGCANMCKGDIISALSFNKTGNFMASGDRAGRVVLFDRPASGNEYRFYTEFQSHESEFDYLKSLEINERINRIEWMNSQPVDDALFLLSTNGTFALTKM